MYYSSGRSVYDAAIITAMRQIFSSSRVVSLSDGIFGFAMTLLVVNLAAPELRSATTDGQLIHALSASSHEFFIFFLSFFLLAMMWNVHARQFNNINKSDNTLTWINILRLFLVVLVPFTSEIVGDHQTLRSAAFLFNLNIFLLCLSGYVGWKYAISHGLTKQMTAKSLADGEIKNLLSCAVGFLACILAFVSPRLSMAVFVLIPIGFFFLKKKGKIF